MLTISSCSKRFGATLAVDAVDLRVPDGQMLGIIGRSGAGKSTLLRLINRLVDPSEGEIRFGEREITRLRGRALLAWRAECAMIFQQFGLVKRLDVITNVLLGRLAHHRTLPSLIGMFSRTERAMAVRILHRLDMDRFALQRADTLSGGQQQRVAIARALMQNPKIILADEPIASLDPRSAAVVMDTLRSINREDGITVVCNLHALDVARAYSDRIVGMLHGKMVFEGPPDGLDPATVREIYGMEEAEEQLAGEPHVAADMPATTAAAQPGAA